MHTHINANNARTRARITNITCRTTVHTHMHVHTYIQTCIHTYMHTHAIFKYVHTCTSMLHTYVRACIHAYRHACRDDPNHVLHCIDTTTHMLHGHTYLHADTHPMHYRTCYYTHIRVYTNTTTSGCITFHHVTSHDAVHFNDLLGYIK